MPDSDLRARLDPHPQYKTLPEALAALAERDRLIREWVEAREAFLAALRSRPGPASVEYALATDVDAHRDAYHAAEAALKKVVE